MQRWLLGLLLACQSGSPNPQSQEPSPEALLALAKTDTAPEVSNLPDRAIDGLGGPGRQVIRLLDNLETAALYLPDQALVPAESGQQELHGPWSQSRGQNSWRVRLPPKFKADISSATPRNLQIFKDKQPLDFLTKNSTPREGRVCWQVDDGWITIHGLENPENWSSPPVLQRRTQRQAMDRLYLAASKLEPVEFVQAEITLGFWTREALLLPAPGTAEFDVEIPEGAVLRMGLGFASVPGLDLTPHAGIEISINAQTIWTDELKATEEWSEVELSLARWGGTDATLSFRATSLGDPTGDWLAFAEPEILGPPLDTGPRRIVVLGIDTLRPDHLGVHGYDRATSPFLDRMAEQSLVFESAWASAPRTRPSFRTVNTGRWPIQARHAPTLGALLHQAGFSTSGIVANVHLSPEMGFSEGYGSWRYAHSGDAADQVDRALGWLEDHQHEDSFLFLHFMDPHIFYLAPEPWTDRFVENRPAGIPDRYNRKTVEQLTERGLLDDTAKDFIEARYDGEIAYLDSQLERLVTSIDALPGRTMVVLLSDHGEEFWDHGEFEHNHSLYQELTRTLFWIRPPKGSLSQGPYRIHADVSLADLTPTLLDLAGLEASEWPPLDGVSLNPFFQNGGEALESSLGDRSLPMGYLMYGQEQWGVVFQGHKYILHRVRGSQELYDLRTDPTEDHDLSDTVGDLSPYWKALSNATGFPTGSGWRLELSQMKEPFSLEFAHPIQAAEIIDPEAFRARRANQEWGDSPPLRSSDVAQLQLTDDGRILHIIPGAYGTGTLALLGAPGHARLLDSAGSPTGDLLLPDQSWDIHEAQIEAKTGVVVLAGETESLLPVISAETDTREALQSLGYLE